MPFNNGDSKSEKYLSNNESSSEQSKPIMGDGATQSKEIKPTSQRSIQANPTNHKPPNQLPATANQTVQKADDTKQQSVLFEKQSTSLSIAAFNSLQLNNQKNQYDAIFSELNLHKVFLEIKCPSKTFQTLYNNAVTLTNDTIKISIFLTGI